MVKSSNQVRIFDTFISNFRSFPPRDREAGPIIADLSDINLFVGPNGSGKTNYLNALRDTIGWHSFNSQGTYTVERNHHDPQHPTEIELTLKIGEDPQTATLKQLAAGRGQDIPTRTPNPANDRTLKERIFPIGVPRNFHEYNRRLKVNRNDDSYLRICANWPKIREDARIVDIELRDTPPKAPQLGDDRFFFDMVDDNGVSLGEGSDGKANALCLIIGIRILPPGSVVIIEEPEVGMHPGLQKQFMEYLQILAKSDAYQFLISTHSPYVMNYVIEANVATVFRFSKDISGHTQVATVSQNIDRWNLLRDLGHSPADVMHANGVVWVEGPSDAVYVFSWLENLAPDLKPYKDYTVMWYGGNEWSHLGTEFWEKAGVKTKLSDLFSLNPNWAFITDSDIEKGKSKLKPSIQQHKAAVIKLCQRHGKFSWVVKPRIEACVRRFMNWKSYPRSKVKSARDYAKRIKDKSVIDIEKSIKADEWSNIQKLVEVVRKWGSS